MILSAVTLITACSSDFEESSVKLDAEETKAQVEKGDSILRFLTIEELEGISISDIPGENSGYELTELTYECTDTIELRALRLDVKATLTSTTQPAKTICFIAEVGPELISVEYYPSVEVVPAHDNFYHSFWPKVERYRNYSDGSRIGPDEFYDYGHFLTMAFQLDHHQIEATRFVPYHISENWTLIPSFFGGNVNPLSIYYKDGVFYYYDKGLIEYNLNTTLIEEDGAIYSGDDFFHTYVKNRDDWGDLRESTSKVRDFYNMYRPSLLYSVSDEEYAYYVNLCRDVPDVSPSPYSKDTKSLSPGWYYGEFNDVYLNQFWLYSKYELSLSENPIYFQHGRQYNLSVGCYLQYLVIDNRIIDFVDIFLKDYKNIGAIHPTFEITKTSSGYMIHSALEEILYGEKFKSVYDLELKGIYGPENIWDLSDYQSTQWKDEDELNNIAKRSRMIEPDMKALIPREDGKAIIIDRHLPKIINNHKTRSSIKMK